MKKTERRRYDIKSLEMMSEIDRTEQERYKKIAVLNKDRTNDNHVSVAVYPVCGANVVVTKEYNKRHCETKHY